MTADEKIQSENFMSLVVYRSQGLFLFLILCDKFWTRSWSSLVSFCPAHNARFFSIHGREMEKRVKKLVETTNVSSPVHR